MSQIEIPMTDTDRALLSTDRLDAARRDDVCRVAIGLGDDALVLGHRLSEWSSKGPSLEEDIALSNLGLDMIGQARLFYQLAARLENRGRDEDQLAYFRDAPEFRNVLLVELPRGDFAFTMARQLAVAAFLHPYYEAMCRTGLSELAEIAAKAGKEMAYHVRHSAEWVIRLGDGTDESRRRMLAGLDAVWPYVDELFAMTPGERVLADAGLVPDRTSFRPGWNRTVDRVLREARLQQPATASNTDGRAPGGRDGRHTPHLAVMLAEMQSLARAHPGAAW